MVLRLWLGVPHLGWPFGLYMWAPEGCSWDPLVATFTWWRAHCCPQCCARCSLLHHTRRRPRYRSCEDIIYPFVHPSGLGETCGSGDIWAFTPSKLARRCHSGPDACWTCRTSNNCSPTCRLRGYATKRAALEWASARGYHHSYRHRGLRCVFVSNMWILAQLRLASIFEAQRIIPLSYNIPSYNVHTCDYRFITTFAVLCIHTCEFKCESVIMDVIT